MIVTYWCSGDRPSSTSLKTLYIQHDHIYIGHVDTQWRYVGVSVKLRHCQTEDEITVSINILHWGLPQLTTRANQSTGSCSRVGRCHYHQGCLVVGIVHYVANTLCTDRHKPSLVSRIYHYHRSNVLPVQHITHPLHVDTYWLVCGIIIIIIIIIIIGYVKGSVDVLIKPWLNVKQNYLEIVLNYLSFLFYT